MSDYLGANPSESDYQALLEEISALIYSDSDVKAAEAQLLTKLQHLDPSVYAGTSGFDKLLRRIQKLYRQAIR